MKKITCWEIVLVLTAVVLALTACGGAMEEATQEPAAEEAAEEAPMDVAPTEEAEGEPLDGVTGADDPSTGEEATPTAVLPTVEPTPDFGTIAYDVPEHMVREKPVEVILLVSPSEEDDLVTALEEELEEVNQDPQNVTTTQIEVARYMFADLDSAPGDAFEIKDHQEGAEIQELTDDEPTQWEWTVVPKKGGTHRLILRIDRMVGEDLNTAVMFKEEVHRDEVTVEVPTGLRVQDAVGGFDLKWLAGVFIFPLLFYILSRRDRNRD